MYPPFHDELNRARIDDLLRLAYEARSFQRRDRRASRPTPRWRLAVGRRLVDAGVRVGGEQLLPTC